MLPTQWREKKTEIDKTVSESKKWSDFGEKNRARKGNGVGKGVCSWCCHANEGGAAAMLTNSNSHCWTHHLLMLYSSPSLPSLSLFLSSSLCPFPSPLLSPGSLFFVRSLSLAVARARALTWQQLGRGRCNGTQRHVRVRDSCVFLRACVRPLCVCVFLHVRIPFIRGKNRISHLNDGDGDQRGEERNCWMNA